MPRDLTNSTLLVRYLAGDSLAAEAIFTRNRGCLKAYLRRRLWSEEAAEEVLQETFCRMLERARQLVDHPRLEAWLFTVARNVSADVLRERRGRSGGDSGQVHGGTGGLVIGQLPGSVESRPESRLRSRELSRLVLLGVDQLTPAERQVFLLRTESVLTFREIAERVGAPLNTVLSRMHRAMKKIRKLMEANGWSQESSARGGELI